MTCEHHPVLLGRARSATLVRETRDSMGMPDWWNRRRLGLFVNATVASVPAWAPIGEDAEWYRSHLGEVVSEMSPHPQPLVEVLAHQRDRWGHIEHYDDFVELLTFDRFDAEEWADLVRSAGAGYTILVSKHHDGWAWWDAPGSAKRLTEHGPRRNVLAEFAAACERHDIAFGTYFSLLDWSDGHLTTEEFVTEVAHAQVLDLVERYGTTMLWGDGRWGRDADDWRTTQLMERVRKVDPDVVINDRWGVSASDVPDDAPGIVRTFDHDCPDEIVDGPWELSRGIGHGFGHNRAERAEHHMTAGEIVDLYTEVLAKGGNLLLGIGPAADGTIPAMQADPLRAAGAWIQRHDQLLAPCRPWKTWGDRDVRYLDAGDEVVAIDLTGRGRFDDLTDRRHVVSSVTDIDGEELVWAQSDAGLAVTPGTAVDGFVIVVCRVTLSEAPAPDALFTLDHHATIPLAPLLFEARPGDLVQLGGGVYVGPADIPDGVIVRGLGATRTTIRAADPSASTSPIDPPRPTLTVGRNARVEHLGVSDAASRSSRGACVSIALDEDFATVLGCTLDGIVTVTGDDILLRAITGRGVRAIDADRLHISRCHFRGNRWDLGVELTGGGGHHVESSEFHDHLCAIRLSGTTGSTARGNTISARWWAIHVDHAEDAHVHGNRIRSTMRAVDVDGGSRAVVDGNAVTGGDSGCIVQDGAADCEVYGNHWDTCRIGLLSWNATSVHHQDNVCSDLHDVDGAFVSGP